MTIKSSSVVIIKIVATLSVTILLDTFGDTDYLAASREFRSKTILLTRKPLCKNLRCIATMVNQAHR